MLTIYLDTDTRGTKARPAFLVYLKYGNLPSQEKWLKATTPEEAIKEVKIRFGCESKIDGQ